LAARTTSCASFFKTEVNSNVLSPSKIDRRRPVIKKIGRSFEAGDEFVPVSLTKELKDCLEGRDRGRLGRIVTEAFNQKRRGWRFE